MKLEDLRVKLFADGADLNHIRHLATVPYIKGFTTNPTLMRKAGVDDYETWAKQVLESVPDKPVSFEVLSDDFDEMERQARKIASWGENVYVKIPITNTEGCSTERLMYKLSSEGVKVNVTAVTTYDQVECAFLALLGQAPSIISVFAGRIADTGREVCGPFTIFDDIRRMVECWKPHTTEFLWASTREVLNIMQANVSCDIITVPDKILNKLTLLDKCLDDVSLDTVKQFRDDAVAAGYTL